MNRDCSFHEECNKDYSNYTRSNAIEALTERESIQQYLFFLALREVILIEYIKLEKVQDFIKQNSLKKSHILGTYSIVEEEACNKKFEDNGYVNVVYATSKKVLREFIHSDTGGNYIKRIIKVGKFLGYPECCIKNAVKSCGNIESMQKFESNEKRIRYDCPLIGGNTRLYVHFPCSSKCAATAEISEKVLLYLREKHGDDLVYDFFSNNLG